MLEEITRVEYTEEDLTHAKDAIDIEDFLNTPLFSICLLQKGSEPLQRDAFDQILEPELKKAFIQPVDDLVSVVKTSLDRIERRAVFVKSEQAEMIHPYLLEHNILTRAELRREAGKDWCLPSPPLDNPIGEEESTDKREEGEDEENEVSNTEEEAATEDAAESQVAMSRDVADLLLLVDGQPNQIKSLDGHSCIVESIRDPSPSLISSLLNQ